MVYYEKRLRALCSEPLTCPALRGARTRLVFRCRRFTGCLLCTFFCICLCVILGYGVDTYVARIARSFYFGVVVFWRS